MSGLERVRADLAGHGLDLLRAWPRGPKQLLLHVRPAGATGSDDAGERDAAKWVAGQWFADDERAAEVAAKTSRPDGSTRGCRHLPGTGVVLQPGGADRRLVGLQGLLREPGSSLLAHRPERRAVVRSGDGRTFTKVVRREQVAALATSAGWRPSGVRVPDVVHVDPAAGTVTTAAVPGRTLHELGPHATPGAWWAAGQAVAALHAAPVPAHARPHALVAEAEVTTTWLQRAQRHGALAPARVEAMADLVAHALWRLHGEGAAPTPVTTHRDLHDKQVLLAGDDASGWSVSVLDLDLVAAAEPGLDLANLLVHLLLRDRQAALRSAGAAPAQAGACAEAFLAGYGPVPDPDRLGDLAVVAAARVAAVYAFRAPLVPQTPPTPPTPLTPGAGGAGEPGAGDDVGGADLGERVLAAVLGGLPGLLAGAVC